MNWWNVSSIFLKFHLDRTSTGRIAIMSLRDDTTKRKFQASRKLRENKQKGCNYQRFLHLPFSSSLVQWKIISIFLGNGNLGKLHTHFPLELCLEWSESRLFYCSNTPRKRPQEFVLILDAFRNLPLGKGSFPGSSDASLHLTGCLHPRKLTAKLPKMMVALESRFSNRLKKYGPSWRMGGSFTSPSFTEVCTNQTEETNLPTKPLPNPHCQPNHFEKVPAFFSSENPWWSFDFHNGFFIPKDVGFGWLGMKQNLHETLIDVTRRMRRILELNLSFIPPRKDRWL